MNPLTNMKNVLKLSEQEIGQSAKSSWHDQYRDSAWIFVGGLPYDLSEGDIVCVFSQYGEIVNINLIRDKDTGKSKGFCFLCYEDQRSTILSVDNLNGIKILNRTIRVDHVAEYKVPKEHKETDEETKKLYAEGCAPKSAVVVPKKKSPPRDFRETIADQIEADIKLPARLPIYPIKQEKSEDEGSDKKKAVKKENNSESEVSSSPGKKSRKRKKASSLSEDKDSKKKTKDKSKHRKKHKRDRSSEKQSKSGHLSSSHHKKKAHTFECEICYGDRPVGPYNAEECPNGHRTCILCKLKVDEAARDLGEPSVCPFCRSPWNFIDGILTADSNFLIGDLYGVLDLPPRGSLENDISVMGNFLNRRWDPLDKDAQWLLEQPQDWLPPHIDGYVLARGLIVDVLVEPDIIPDPIPIIRVRDLPSMQIEPIEE